MLIAHEKNDTASFVPSVDMPLPSTRLSQQIAIVFAVPLSWLCLDFIIYNYFEFLQINDFQYSIYWLSAVRLLFIVLFGWLGALGLFIGYFAGGVYVREFSVETALALGLISALTPLLAYSLWNRFTGYSNHFEDVSVRALFLLVFLHSAFTAAARAAYFYITGIDTGTTFFWEDFLANAVGAVLFLYLLKLGNWAFKASKGGF
jgi:hypothetical protein